jgi:GntR family transcriptional regulator/MocR family aminotransferase
VADSAAAIESRAFQVGCPRSTFPTETWARLLARRARTSAQSAFGYDHAAGHPALREAIAGYLGAARGVVCEPEQVIVVAGAQAGIALACHALLDPGDAAWIEEPGYLGARGALLAASAALVPVPVDDEGIDVVEGARRAPHARLVYASPSHQLPLGVTTSLPRRLALLDWAARAGAWVLEDDYDSEFRYGGRPIAAMQGIDAAGRVIYLGGFSKTMFPALRVGYLVVPPALVDPFTVVMRHTGHSAPVVQAALADFILTDTCRHVRRMRALCGRQGRSCAPRSDGWDARGAPRKPACISSRLPKGVDDVAAARRAGRKG